MSDDIKRRLGAEAFGTFWLVFGGCGSAVLAATYPDLGIGFVGVSLAFGLSVLTMVYAVGHISGGHFNPAVTVGLTVSGRFDRKDVPMYVAAQLVGAIAAAAVLFLVASGKSGFHASDGFAANGYGQHSPGRYGLAAALVIEVVLTAFFLIVILGATAKAADSAFGGVAIGLALTLIHLISIPVTNTSVNPARSTSQALFAGPERLAQLWVFWLAPLAGGVLGALVWRYLLADAKDEEFASGEA